MEALCIPIYCEVQSNLRTCNINTEDWSLQFTKNCESVAVGTASTFENRKQLHKKSSIKEECFGTDTLLLLLLFYFITAIIIE